MTFDGRYADPWHDPTLTSPFTAGSPTPQFRVDDAGTVHLRGRVTRNAAGASAAAFTLPEAYWPTALVRKRIAANPATALARATVSAAGVVTLIDDSGTVTDYDIDLSFSTY